MRVSGEGVTWWGVMKVCVWLGGGNVHFRLASSWQGDTSPPERGGSCSVAWGSGWR